MNELPDRSIAWGRILYTAASIGGAGILTYFFAQNLHNSPEIITVVSSIFSILAGVLIAVISILGDPSMLMDQSWRYNYLSSKEIQRKLHRKIDIFVLYIVILAALFVFAMLDDKTAAFYHLMQRIVFFLCLLGFFASVSLPISLRTIQRERLNAAIAAAKDRT